MIQKTVWAGRQQSARRGKGGRTGPALPVLAFALWRGGEFTILALLTRREGGRRGAE